MVNIEQLKMIFGFILLLTLVGLAATMALGHIEERTSYGLMPVLVAISTLSGGFSNWAFGNSSSKGE